MPLSTFTSQEIEHLTRLIRGIKVAMFTTVCADGSLHSRPMATQEAFLDCSLWFFTRLDAPKVNEIEN
jgi:general stress protein 26